METTLKIVENLTTCFLKSTEWLVVRANSGSSSLNAAEIEITGDRGRPRIAFVSDGGYRTFAIRSWSEKDGEVAVEVAANFGRDVEMLRFVPRTPARELADQVEISRLMRAGEIARLVAENFQDLKLRRVGLNGGNGRLAVAIYDAPRRAGKLLIADVTESVTAEAILASGLLLFNRLCSRPRSKMSHLMIAAPKKPAKALQKLCGLLRGETQSLVETISIDDERRSCQNLRSLRLGDLWREKPTRLVLPENITDSATAARIAAGDRDAVDIIHSRQGETLRYRGLAIARVRSMLGRERLWYGVDGGAHVPAGEGDGLGELLRDLRVYRRADSPNPRHRLYSAAAESWLESILRRDITRLDPNLVLAPIYNQFRTSHDKIDLLAIRRDGRLVIIELKVDTDREMVLQAADYWRKIESQRRSGQLERAKLFGDRAIIDKPALIYAVAPALAFHRDFEFFARALNPEIELWRFELHKDWRRSIKVIGRKAYGRRDGDHGF